MLLDKINSIDDLRKINIDDFPRLSDEIRELIIDVVSKNGGHLASSLGVVELTLALHYVFNTPEDRIIWDVGHQAYAHKILTGRKDLFHTIRKFKGLSGFPKYTESPFDTYNVGHSSTSLSLAQGEAIGRDLKGEKHKVIAVIGDGSLTNGMAFEALNQVGHMDNDIIIILNDNEHSISKNVGAMSKYFNRIITGSLYNKFRRKSMTFIKRIPKLGVTFYDFLYRFFESFKSMIIPGLLFEELGIRYFGPVDGHNIESLVEMFNSVKNINYGPKIIHVLTKKGKGYLPAEMDPSRFHGISPFEKETGRVLDNGDNISYSDVVGKTLAVLAEEDSRIIALTAAMKLGTGLLEFENRYPDRVFDVGIAEQHMLTMASALARTGMIPFVSIYSTFLQRAVDQIIHDVGIMNVPVKLLIDRAGIVGEDGETHHGVYDISIIKNIPNFVVIAPAGINELRGAIRFAAEYNKGPIAVRYPRGKEPKEKLNEKVPRIRFGKSVKLRSGKDIAIFAVGDMVETALTVADKLEKKGLSAAVLNLLFIKPLDIKSIENAIRETTGFLTLENGSASGGIGEQILSLIENKLKTRFLKNFGFPDEFITHGSMDQLFRLYKLDPDSIVKKILRMKEK